MLEVSPEGQPSRSVEWPNTSPGLSTDVSGDGHADFERHQALQPLQRDASNTSRRGISGYIAGCRADI